MTLFFASLRIWLHQQTRDLFAIAGLLVFCGHALISSGLTIATRCFGLTDSSASSPYRLVRHGAADEHLLEQTEVYEAFCKTRPFLWSHICLRFRRVWLMLWNSICLRTFPISPGQLIPGTIGSASTCLPVHNAGGNLILTWLEYTSKFHGFIQPPRTGGELPPWNKVTPLEGPSTSPQYQWRPDDTSTAC